MVRRDTIVLEPRSRIASFDAIGFRTIQAVNGAIAASLFGKDREKKGIFYKSKASRKNKQILAKLTSEIYSYLNGVISEFADPEDYFFRLWVRVEIDKKTGEIIGRPLFDIDMFKYVSKLGGKYVEVGDYALEVVFIGKEGTLISPFFIKGIRKVASDTKLIRFRHYDSYSVCPEEIKQQIMPDSPYLIVGNKQLRIELEIDKEDTKIIPYVKKENKQLELVDQSAVHNLILREIALRPEIRKAGIFFQSVDEELKKIEKRLGQHATDEEEPDLPESLRIEQILEELKQKLQSVNTEKLSDLQKKAFDKQGQKIESQKAKYLRLSSEWKALRDDISNMKKDLDAGEVEYEQFRVLKIRRSKALRNTGQELIEFQEDLKSKIIPEFNEFMTNVEKMKK